MSAQQGSAAAAPGDAMPSSRRRRPGFPFSLADRVLGTLPIRPLWRGARCLFVLSCGRCGTETLAHVLGLSPAMTARHEPQPQLMPERKVARTAVHGDPKPYERMFITARCRALLAARFRSKVYAETSARLTFFAPVIARLLPESRFVFLHRHPGDIVRSGMRRGWYVGHRADRHRIEPVAGEPHFADWASWSPFEKICWYWDAYHRFILDFLPTLPADRQMEAPSTELFDPDSGACERIFEFLNVPAPPRELIARELGHRHNSQGAGEFPAFRDWTSEQRAILRRLAGETMLRLGYEAP